MVEATTLPQSRDAKTFIYIYMVEEIPWRSADHMVIYLDRTRARPMDRYLVRPSTKIYGNEPICMVGKTPLHGVFAWGNMLSKGNWTGNHLQTDACSDSWHSSLGQSNLTPQFLLKTPWIHCKSFSQDPRAAFGEVFLLV